MMQSITKARSSLSVIPLLAIALIGCYSRYSPRSSELRQQLVDLAENIHLGDDDEKADRQLEENCELSIRVLMIDNKVVVWRISTPLEFGATNWVLFVMLEGNEIVGRGIRTNDSDFDRPNDAPQDRVTPSFEALWRQRFGS